LRFHAVLCTLRKTTAFPGFLPVEALSESDVEQTMKARVVTDRPYNLDDIPDSDDG
jgi:hypothetical protein